MHPDLEKLLDLQAKDLILLATDVRLKGVADEIAGLDAGLDRARADVETAQRRLAEGTTRREELEQVIESQRTLQEKRRTRIEQVKTAREVQALMTELDAARQTLARQESDWVKAAEATQQQDTLMRTAFSTISEAYSHDCDSRPIRTSAERVIARIPQWISE